MIDPQHDEMSGTSFWVITWLMAIVGGTVFVALLWMHEEREIDMGTHEELTQPVGEVARLFTEKRNDG